MPNYYDLPPVEYDDDPVGSREYEIVQWCEDRLKRGIKFIESQVGYDKIDHAINQIFQNEKETGASYVPGPKPLSQTRCNLTAKVAEDLVAQLTDTRYFWNYKTYNSKYQQQTDQFNKSAKMWWVDNNIDLRVGDVMRYYTVAGTGVAHIYYSRIINDIYLEAEDPRNVFPIDPMSYHGFEDCMGVILRRPRTPEYVKEMFDKMVRPDTGATGGFFGWLKRVVEGPGERGGPLSKKSNADREIPGTPTVFVNTMYLKDPRTNTMGRTVRMGKWSADGKPLTRWSYEVKPNAPLYPFRRLLVWGGGTLLEDGPSPYWHSRFPLIKFTLNPWPKSWFGKAPLWDVLPLQKSLDANLRVVDDHAAQVAQPALIGDRNVSRAEMNKANTRQAGMKIRMNTASGKGLQIVNPPPLDATIWEIIQWCEEKMQKIGGTVDPSSIASLGQIPSDDTIDTLMKAMTPAVRLRSRILEGCYKELSKQYLYNSLEFDTLSQRVMRFGPTAVTPEDYDFNPGTMIPDDVPDGDLGDIAGTEDALASDNPRPEYVRAKYMLASIGCEFDPSSLLNTAAQQDLMKYFLLAKMGYLSVFTLMDKMGITNFAPASLNVPPDEVSRLQLQQTLGIGMIANAQGRKATDSAPPALGVTGNGPTITTS